ncbi:hypothetical protein F2P56_031492, partial [Juglans regia]
WLVTMDQCLRGHRLFCHIQLGTNIHSTTFTHFNIRWNLRLVSPIQVPLQAKQLVQRIIDSMVGKLKHVHPLGNEDTKHSRETEDGSAETSQNVQMDGDDMIEEPKSGMEFNSLEDLMSYYKQYGKKCGFGVMTKRTERGDDETVRYVTIACARGGKARNRTFNVANPRPTGKTECKAKINALKSDGKFRLTTVHNIHNHGLSPRKSRFFRCNRKVSDVVKRVLDTNDLAGI